MQIQMIPLNQLVPSSANVRRTGAKAEIKALAASIKAHGLLQNLQVRCSGGDTFEVVAGGRRLAALNLLVKQKAMSAKDEIPCHVLDAEDAQEISLAENTLRLPMHPADQYEAFCALTETGKGPEEIAARFGITAAAVRQRLKLAAVSPRLFALYRKDEMTLDQLMAFTVLDDHTAQEAAWFERPDWQRDSGSIRRTLMASHVEADDGRVRFIGLGAYKKAGGGVVCDLFQRGHEGYLTDPGLLDRLVAVKLERKAKALRAEGWKWVEIMPKIDYDMLHRYGRLYREHKPLNAEQRKELDKLTREYDALAELGDSPDEDASEKLDALSDKIEDLSQGEAVWTQEILALSGTIVAIGRDGEVKIERGLVRPEDRQTSAAKERNVKAGAEAEASSDPAAPHSTALVEDLTAQRTAALRTLLKDNGMVALAAIAHALILPLFYGAAHGAQSCLDIRIESRELRCSADGIERSRAFESTESAWELWKEQLPRDEATLFGWLLKQDQSTVIGLIAFGTAMSIDAVRGKHDRPDCTRLIHADELASALGLDMAAWWQPTKENYLQRVSKKLVLAAVAEGVSPQAAENLATLKKDALAENAEQRLARTGWLPAFLRSLHTVQAANLTA